MEKRCGKIEIAFDLIGFLRRSLRSKKSKVLCGNRVPPSVCDLVLESQHFGVCVVECGQVIYEKLSRMRKFRENRCSDT